MKKRAHRRSIPGYMKVMIPLLPFLVAFAVYIVYYLNLPADKRGPLTFLDAFFDSIGVYSFKLETKAGFSSNLLNNASFQPVLKWVLVILGELARIGGLLITAGFFYALLSRSFRRIANIYYARRRDSIALHGDPALVGLLKKELGNRAITSGDDVALKASNHVLLYRSNSDMLSFLEKNYDSMTQHPDSKIWLYTTADLHDQGINDRLVINQVPANCAKLYWQKHWLRPGEKNIVFIGFGAFGQALLTEALCTNLYSDPEWKISYHVFGDSRDYRLCHSQLESFLTVDKENSSGDSLFFHADVWNTEPDLIRNADRVILCDDDSAVNLGIMDLMIAGRLNQKVHIRLQNDSTLNKVWKCDKLADPERHPGGTMEIRAFGTDKELYTLDRVTNDSLYRRGKMIHAYYYFTAVRGMSVDQLDPLSERLNDPGFLADWNSLSAYYRDSSLMQDSHAYVKARILLQCWDREIEGHAKEAYERYKLTGEKEKETLWELEHRRWARVLYINGWRYAPVRNNDALEHPLLVPFDLLDYSDKVKDANAWEMLRHLDAGL